MHNLLAEPEQSIGVVKFSILHGLTHHPGIKYILTLSYLPASDRESGRESQIPAYG